MHDGEKGVVEAIWLLLSSTICVPLVVKLLPGGSPVLGYLLGGAIVGPYALGLIQDVQVCASHGSASTLAYRGGHTCILIHACIWLCLDTFYRRARLVHVIKADPEQEGRACVVTVV